MYTPRDWQLMLFGSIHFLLTLVFGSIHRSRNPETETVSGKREISYSEKFHGNGRIFICYGFEAAMSALHALVRSAMRMETPGLCCDSSLLQLRLCYDRSWVWLISLTSLEQFG